MLGDDAYDYMGMALEALDWDGDGVDDLFSGSIYADPLDRDGGGEVYGALGRTSLPVTVDLSASEEDVRVLGAEPLDQCGSAIISPDLNGDGISDLAVGVQRADPGGRTDAGGVSVFLGTGRDTACRRRAVGSGDPPALDFGAIELIMDPVNVDSQGVFAVCRFEGVPAGVGCAVLGRHYTLSFDRGGTAVYRVALRYREMELQAAGIAALDLRVGVLAREGWRTVEAELDTASHRIVLMEDLVEPHLLALGDASSLSVLCGDANQSGDVTPADGYAVLNFLGAGPVPPSMWASDVDGNPGLTPADGYVILNALGSGPTFACEGYPPPSP
jgi:hypothetical protein